MLKGIIIKNYNGFFYVKYKQQVFECKLRGRLKHVYYSLVVGDRVFFNSTEFDKGIIVKILPRKSLLFHPKVANITQVIIVFSAVNPNFDLSLIDKFLVLSEASGFKSLICINKLDLCDVVEVELSLKFYSQIGYQINIVSAHSGVGIKKLQKSLLDEITVFSGPSGVGKSSILNAIEPGLKLTIGNLCKKNSRGKNTTCFAQLLPLANGFIIDTPGFSFTEFNNLRINELDNYFPEMTNLQYNCKFRTCLHHFESQCAIKQAVNEGIIIRTRYQSYIEILKKLIKNKDGIKYD